MSTYRTLATVAICLGLASATATAGWFDSLKDAIGSIGKSSSTSEAIESVLSNDEITSGLKEALSVGVDRAIKILGADGGFLNDATVRIPMPGFLEKARPALRLFGQEKLADDFEATVNHAAERAVPLAASVFGNAIRDMSIDDARAILGGADDSATTYFREHTGEALKTAMLPIVSEATNETGVTSSYKKLVDKAGSLVSDDDLDLDSYVTDKAIDGLFLKLADEERKIRSDPLARSTKLLKKVFSAASK